MRKILFTVAYLFAAMNVTAQNFDFGVKAGYAHFTGKIDVEDVSISIDEPAFFLGVLGEFGVSNAFAIQPELLFARMDGGNVLYVPVMAKFYVGSNFNLQAGPQMTFVLEDTEDLNELGFDLAFGAGYDITNNFFIDARYALELTNRYTGEGSDQVTEGTIL